ncbi:transglutaminaseTgpA domain-containing protein [Agromyces sp. NPDC058136]|uniref:transglutaminase family protein n=1 Tax=Agromyces sp. NPDC058136 TaxID=3346354 RepID=UPI0036D8E050
MPLTRGQRLALTAASFLLLAVATMALGPLISGSGWWWLCAFVAAGVLFGGAGLRAVRVPASLVPVLEIVVLVLLLTLLFGGSTSFALIVPTVDTFGLFGELFEGAQRTIQQQSVPAIPVPPLNFVLAVGVGILAISTDVLVQTVRMPALAAAPALVPILIPGFLIEAGAEVPTLVFSAAAYLLLLRIDVRARRRAMLAAAERADETGGTTVIPPARVPMVSSLGATLGLTVVGLLTASVLTASTPSISSSLLLGSGASSTSFARGVSPFIDLGRDLRRPEPRPAFHYFARDNDRPYFTVLTLDRFEGAAWGVTEQPVDADNTVDALPKPQGLDEDVAATEHPIDVIVDEVRTTWLPLPYPTRQVEGLNGSWFWSDDSLTVRSVDADTGGQRYTATWLEVDPTPAQLRAAGGRAGEEFDRYLELPDDAPPIIGDTATAVAGSAATQYDAAVAIQSYLRGIDFEYSTEAPVEAGYDGGGFEVIAEFLEERSGYCVHFASTMAVLAREVGIPSRISVGYTSGTPTQERVEGVQRVEVDSHDLHAWPELYFEGVGWVPFEPTPSRGTVPEYSRPGAGSAESSPVSPSSSATAPASGRPELDPDRNLTGASGSSAAGDSWWLRGGVLLLLVAGLLLAPAAFRTWQRGVRHRRIARGERPADAAWDELLATARDLGVRVDPAATPRATAALLAEREGFAPEARAEEGAEAEAVAEAADARAALTRLRDAVERERYGPGAAGEGAPEASEPLIAALATVRGALAEGESLPVRWRAVLAPRSLIDRARPTYGERSPVDA